VESVRALRALFAGRSWPGGEHVPAMDGPLLHRGSPAAVPPIWIGGTSEGTVRAAATEGDGWNAWGIDPDAFAAKAELLRASSGGRVVEPTWGGVVVVGRDADEAERLVTARRDRGMTDDSFAGDADATVGWLSRFAEAGATWVVLLPGGAADRIEVIGELVLPRLRATP